MPSFSFIVPTAGRSELETCLQSIVPQLEEQDEVLVVGDTLDGALPQTEAIVKKFPAQVKYLPYAGKAHTFGHQEINYGISQAKGDLLSFNDDDDIWIPGAVKKFRAIAAVYANRPLLFRYLSYFGYLSWVERGLFEEGYVGGHCLICPNTPSRLGVWTDRYEGDWDFVEQTVSKYDELIWCEEVIAVARPDSGMIAQIQQLAGI